MLTSVYIPELTPQVRSMVRPAYVRLVVDVLESGLEVRAREDGIGRVWFLDGRHQVGGDFWLDDPTWIDNARHALVQLRAEKQPPRAGMPEAIRRTCAPGKLTL